MSQCGNLNRQLYTTACHYQCIPIIPTILLPAAITDTAGFTCGCHSPTSGFYCPGEAHDRINDPPGSKPIIVPVGDTSSSLTQVQTLVTESTRVETTLTLEGDDPTAVNLTRIRHNLAKLYDVPLELISLEISAGSVVINVFIIEGTTPELSIASLLTVVSSQAEGLSQALDLDGLNVSSTPPVLGRRNVTTTETVTTFVVADCPAGSW